MRAENFAVSGEPVPVPVVRWLGRFCLEAHGVRLEDVRVASQAFGSLPGSPEQSMEMLAGVCHRYSLDRG